MSFPTNGSAALRIPFDEAGFQETTQFESVLQNGRVLWKKHGEDGERFDLIAGAYRLLQMLDETQVAAGARDRRGIFHNGGLPPARAAVDALPLVEHHAAALLEMLRRAGNREYSVQVPKWPGGKAFAVCITHDTDAVRAAAPMELATNLVKWLVRRNRIFLDLAKAGLRRQTTRKPIPSSVSRVARGGRPSRHPQLLLLVLANSRHVV